MSAINSIDMVFLDALFDMEAGYVLNFSNRTFSDFFATEVGVDIDSADYQKNGTSKAKRFRTFLREASNRLAARALKAMRDYRTALQEMDQSSVSLSKAEERILEILRKLDDSVSTSARKPDRITTSISATTFAALRVRSESS